MAVMMWNLVPEEQVPCRRHHHGAALGLIARGHDVVEADDPQRLRYPCRQPRFHCFLLPVVLRNAVNRTINSLRRVTSISFLTCRGAGEGGKPHTDDESVQMQRAGALLASEGDRKASTWSKKLGALRHFSDRDAMSAWNCAFAFSCCACSSVVVLRIFCVYTQQSSHNAISIAAAKPPLHHHHHHHRHCHHHPLLLLLIIIIGHCPNSHCHILSNVVEARWLSLTKRGGSSP